MHVGERAHQCSRSNDMSNFSNLGQRVVDMFTKLSKIGFSMECFTAGFLRFFTRKGQNFTFGWLAAYSSSNTAISGIFLKFP